MKVLKRNMTLLIIFAIYVVLEVLNRTGIINSYLMQIVMFAGINIIMTVSLNIINGFTGQFSIGQAGFMSVGAYASAVITRVLFNTYGWPIYMQIPIFLVSLVVGGIAAAFIGFLIGIPTLKVKRDYLAIVTLGFGEIVRAVIRLIQPIGGARGLSAIPQYTNLFWIFVFVVLAVYVARNFVNSTFGRACISIRENEIAAETMGIDTTKFKILSFTFASFLSGVAGGLYAHLLTYIQPDMFSFVKSTDYLVFLYAGGMSSISGSIVSALVLTALPEFLRFLASWRMVLYGLLLIVLMLKMPNGLFGGKEFKFLQVRNTKRTVEAAEK